MEMQNQCAEIKIRAERRAGELLADTTPGSGRPKKFHGGTFLSDAGVSNKQSHRWQQIATVPEADFEAHITDTRAARDELTTAGVLRLAKRVRQAAAVEARAAGTARGCTVKDLARLVKAKRTFGTIYADPPWKYVNQGTRAATGDHYDTMTVAEIAALPVADLAADNAHLHLWTTNALLRRAQSRCVRHPRPGRPRHKERRRADRWLCDGGLADRPNAHGYFGVAGRFGC